MKTPPVPNRRRCFICHGTRKVVAYYILDVPVLADCGSCNRKRTLRRKAEQLAQSARNSAGQTAATESRNRVAVVTDDTEVPRV